MCIFFTAIKSGLLPTLYNLVVIIEYGIYQTYLLLINEETIKVEFSQNNVLLIPSLLLPLIHQLNCFIRQITCLFLQNDMQFSCQNQQSIFYRDNFLKFENRFQILIIFIQHLTVLNPNWINIKNKNRLNSDHKTCMFNGNRVSNLFYYSIWIDV